MSLRLLGSGGDVAGQAVAATVCTPLRAEQAALAGRIRTPLSRTGRGPAGRLPDPAGPVLVAGVAGGLYPAVRPGDLVVADRVAVDRPGASGGRLLSTAPLLAGELRRHGLTVHVGGLVSTPAVVDGDARGELIERVARTGRPAIAVDTETGYLAEQAGHWPFAAVRAIVDTPAERLASVGLPARGLAGLRSLRRAAPALDAWADALADRELLLAGPRSFCAGVERAIEIVERALAQYGPPVYVRRQIVHNIHVVHDLERRGAIFVDELGEVPVGSVAVLAAHGVAPTVRAEAVERELRVIDATCPLVSKVHTEVRRFASRAQTVFLIGHHDHEEVVGTRGEAPDRVVVVADPEEAERVQIADPDRVSYVMQTTLAVDEAEQTAAVLRRRFPALAAPRTDDICYATTNRQRAVRAVARESELVVVIGSQNSSNSHRLAEVAEAEGTTARLVDDAGGVELGWLRGVRRIGITAGASAPPALVDELVRCLSGFGATTVRETSVVDENIRFTLPREVS